MLRRRVLLVLAVVMLFSFALTGPVSAAGNARAAGVIVSTDSATQTFVLQQNRNLVQAFVVDADAQITNLAGATLTFADLAAGQKAQVVYVIVDQVLHARKVIVVTPLRPQHIIFTGYVVGLDGVARSLTVRNRVGDQAFLVNDATTYRGVAGFAELALGQYVLVQAVRQGDAWLAERVAITPAPRIELQGLVAAIDAGASTFTLRTVTGDYVALVDAETVFMKDGQVAAFADLRVGDRVKARLLWLPAGTWLAKRVVIVPTPPVNFGGLVTEKAAATFAMQTMRPNSASPVVITISVDDNTVYLQNEVEVTYDQVTVGSFVRVQALAQPDGSWLAKKVIIVTPPRVEFRGVVLEIGTDRFSISSAAGPVAFLVDGETEFDDCGEPATFADLVVGDTVKVMAVSFLDTALTPTWLAKQVCILPPAKTTVVGVVTAKGSADFTVRSMQALNTFAVNDATVYQKIGVASPTFADLAVDDSVVVNATKQTDGSWLAVKVVIGPRMGPGGH